MGDDIGREFAWCRVNWRCEVLGIAVRRHRHLVAGDVGGVDELATVGPATAFVEASRPLVAGSDSQPRPTMAGCSGDVLAVTQELLGDAGAARSSVDVDLFDFVVDDRDEPDDSPVVGLGDRCGVESTAGLSSPVAAPTLSFECRRDVAGMAVDPAGLPDCGDDTDVAFGRCSDGGAGC